MERLDDIESESFDHDQIEASRKETLRYLKKLLSEIDFSMETTRTISQDESARLINSLKDTELGLNQINLLSVLLLQKKLLD